MENLGRTMIRNQNSVYISTLKRVSLHCGIKLLFHLQFVNYKEQGGGDQIRLHMSYYVKQAYQKFMDVIMIFRRILHRKTDIHCIVHTSQSFLSFPFFSYFLALTFNLIANFIKDNNVHRLDHVIYTSLVGHQIHPQYKIVVQITIVHWLKRK